MKRDLRKAAEEGKWNTIIKSVCMQCVKHLALHLVFPVFFMHNNFWLGVNHR